MQDVLIIGAGVAGLTVANKLHHAGRDVLILEKSRGPSGRSSTRTVSGNRVDHGAQYFTVRDENFQQQVNLWLEQGHLKIWANGFHRLTDKGIKVPDLGHPRYVFPNGMNTIGKLLGEGLNIQTQTKVTQVRQEWNYWVVSSDTGEIFEAKTVILNMPAEQALALCNVELGNLRSQLQSVVMEPCFALMLGYEKSLAPSWQGLHVEVSSPLSWIAHDSSKRLSPTETVLVVHSTPHFAKEHFEEPLETVKSTLLSALCTLLPAYDQPHWNDMQRWKYALASTYLSERFLAHDSLFFCGDWCGGAKLEAAYLSGLALAKHLGV